MINIKVFGKSKASTGTGSGGSSSSNNNIYFGGIEGHYLWGNYFDATQDIDGDLHAENSTIFAKLLSATTANIGSISANTTNTNHLTVTGTTQMNQVSVDGTSTFNGYTTFNEIATFNEDAVMEKNLMVEGDIETNGDLYVENGDSYLSNVYSDNITNEDTITTKNLNVTGSAHFFELIIDKIRAVGGAVILSPANGFVVDEVLEITNGYRLFFRAEDAEGKAIANMWEVGDQAICQSFNKAVTGTSYNVSNKYYWTLVTAVSQTPVTTTIYGQTAKCHYIDISTTDYDGNVDPEIGDEIAMLGARNPQDPARQSAIYISAYDSLDHQLTAPLIAQYQYINDYSLSSHRKSYFDADSARFIGSFQVQTMGQTPVNLDSYIKQTMGNEFLLYFDTTVINRDPSTSVNTPSSIKVAVSAKYGDTYTSIPSLPSSDYRITWNEVGSSAYTVVATEATPLPYTDNFLTANSRIYTLWKKAGSTWDYTTATVISRQTIPVVQNGIDGQDGEDGQDGTGTSGEFDTVLWSVKTAIVDAAGNVNVTLNGQLKHIIGSTIQPTWTWTGYRVHLYLVDGQGITSPISPHPTNGTFTYSGVAFRDYYDAQTQPEQVIVEIRQGTTVVLKDIIPIGFLGNSLFEVTDEHIEAAVQGIDGRLSDLEITASGLTSDVTNLQDSMSEIEQTASGITSRVQDMQVGATNLVKRTSFKSKDWVFGTGEYLSDATDLWEQESVRMSFTPQSYVWDEVYDEVNAPDIKSGIMFYRINSRENDPFDYYSDPTKYISFRQKLYAPNTATNTYTCRLKPNTWYTLSFLVRGANAQSHGTHILTLLDNCKQGTAEDKVYVDGVETTNTSTYFAQEWYVNWNITRHSFTFKTGSLIGQDDNLPTLYFRIVENSLISIGQVQIEESTVPSKWRESSYDTDYYMSEIRQEADNISLSVTNITNGLDRTGIDIEDGVITLTADNTNINGNLNLNNPQDGFVMYDSNQQPNIILLNDSVALNGQKQTYNLTEEAVVDNIFIVNTYTQSLGRIIKGSKLRIDKFNQWYQIGTIPAAAFFSGSAKAEVTGIARIKNSSGQTVATINTITYQTTATQPSATGLIPFFSTDYAEFTIPYNDTYTVEEEITCTLLASTSGTGTTYHAATYYVNKDNLSVIGTDGFTFRTNTNTVLYGNANEIAMQNGQYNTIKVIDNHAVRSSLEYRGTTQVINGVYGDISTTPEFRAINTSSTNYVINQYDGVITISNADILLPADNSQIPVGKVWYIIPLTITMGGGACHLQKNGNNLEGLGSNPYLSSRYKVYTLIYIGANQYVIT